MSRNTISRLGEKNRSRAGQMMEIIRYGSSTDIDVQFEDGTIKEHCRYDNFKNGNIANPNYTVQHDRLGETVMANNGQEMTIVRYGSSTDIDVQFEDGTIKEHCRYDNFRNGNIANPNYTAQDNRLGETVTASNGQAMIIIRYGSSTDIDVQFEDGTIRTNVRYDNFKNGNIANPNYNYSFIGEQGVANNGQKMRIIDYRSSTDIDIMFEDGTIRTNVRYDNFKNGAVANPNRIIDVEASNDIDNFLSLSTGMRKIITALKERGQIFQLEKIFDLCFYRGYLPFDLFIQGKGVIEYDGEQHFKNKHYYPTDEAFVESAIRDQVKNCFCEMYNIPLLRIRFDQEDKIDELIDAFIATPNVFLKQHNLYMTNEQYYAIRETAELLADNKG